MALSSEETRVSFLCQEWSHIKRHCPQKRQGSGIPKDPERSKAGTIDAAELAIVNLPESQLREVANKLSGMERDQSEKETQTAVDEVTVWTQTVKMERPKDSDLHVQLAAAGKTPAAGGNRGLPHAPKQGGL